MIFEENSGNNSYNSYILGDSVELLKKIPNNTFDLILTDPPYNKNWSAGYLKDIKRSETGIFNDYKSEKVLVDVFSESFRCLKDNKPVFSFCSWDTLPFFVNLFQDLGLKHKNTLIWDKCKRNTLGDWEGSFSSQYEVILYFTKGRYILNTKEQLPQRKGDILRCKPIHKKLHPHQKPLELLKELITYTSIPNDLILDPFAGSGSTYFAANKVDRQCLAIEIDSKWYIGDNK